MFTGLIQELGELARVAPHGAGKSLWIELPVLSRSANLGDSIAINGTCLTVVEIEGPTVRFDLSPETLAMTTLSQLSLKAMVNVEPSLRAGDPLGGHFVQGHVDGVGELLERMPQDSFETFRFSVPPGLAKFVAGKGSIAVDGISLTVVEACEDSFTVALIPHTLQSTNLGRMRVGTQVNLETDMLARYLARIVAMAPSPARTGEQA
jgi:riboflavin synthase